ncbi:MAG: DUF4369 domain-containing protein [Prevotella sp.]|nr:DUF4369 domain-containing protein [Prevotella sp.]
MNRVFYAFFLLAAFTSCAESAVETYNIQGSSSLSALDGSRLYLEIFKEDSLASRDSCEVIHGEFSFTGQLDSLMPVGSLVLGEAKAPIFIERGDIKVSIDKTGIKVSGSPLNEQLYEYLEQQLQLSNLYDELGSRQAKMLLEGKDEKTINALLMEEARRIESQADSLQVSFITSHFDSMLGTVAFQLLANNVNQTLGYPFVTDQMEQILIKAPESFKRHPFVKRYLDAAQDFMARMKGEEETQQ